MADGREPKEHVIRDPALLFDGFALGRWTAYVRQGKHQLCAPQTTEIEALGEIKIHLRADGG